jgi:hypothetical protein
LILVKKETYAASLCVIFCLVGCGRNSKSSEKNETNATGSGVDVLSWGFPSRAFTLASLPACDSKTESALVYVIDQKLMKYCSNGTWNEVAAQSNNVSEVWEYNTDSYIGKPDLSDNSQLSVKIGNVQVSKFVDGSLFVSASGFSFDFNSSNNPSGPEDKTTENFSYSFWIPKASNTLDKSLIFNSFNGAVIRFRINPSAINSIQISFDLSSTYPSKFETYTLEKRL